MRPALYILAIVLALLIFGLPILGCLMGLLSIVLGVAVEASMTIGMFLTVALVVGIGVKVFFLDE